LASPRTDNVDPRWTNDNTDMADPKRAKLRIDKDEPRVPKPNTDTLLPKRAQPLIESEDAMRDMLRRDREAPMCA